MRYRRYRFTVNQFYPIRQLSPSDVIDDIATRYGITREQAGNLPVKTILRVTRDKEIVDTTCEVLP